MLLRHFSCAGPLTIWILGAMAFLVQPLPDPVPCAPLVDRADRCRGALFGLAWGDVLGSPVESWSADSIRRIHGQFDDLPERHPWKTLRNEPLRVVSRLRPIGLHTDDTQQALALLVTVAHARAFTPESWALLLVEGRHRSSWRGTGSALEAALDRLQDGVPPRRAGSPSAGIGAAMRTGPAGALLSRDPSLLEKVVMESSLVTHGDLRAASLAMAVALATADLVEGRSVDQVVSSLPSRLERIETCWIQGHVDWPIVRDHGHSVSQALAALFTSGARTPDQVREVVRRLAAPHLPPDHPRHPSDPFVLLGGLHAVGIALLSPGPPRELLVDIVRQGYDTDTVAAIAGTLLGARHGASWIPHARFVDGERLRAHADALAGAAPLPETSGEQLRRESQLSHIDRSHQVACSMVWWRDRVSRPPSIVGLVP